MRIQTTTDDGPVTQLLAAAELWLCVPAEPASERVRMVTGWEDGYPYCAAVCTTDVGLAFCRACPEDLVRAASAGQRSRKGTCPAGVGLLAFPVSRDPGSGTRVAVLRVAPPSGRAATAAATAVKVAPAVLRRAAARLAPASARAVRATAAVLRDPDRRVQWQADQRRVAADSRRAGVAALAQMAATAEELTELYQTARRERIELERSRRRVDRLAQEAVRAKDDERALIAHQIHDTAAQSMVSAFRFLDAARAAAAHRSLDPDVDRQLAEASDRLLTAIREVRGVLAQVLPPGLEELGVGSAIRARMRYLLQERAGIGLTGDVDGELPRFVGWVEQAIYSMVGEALTNAVRHSAARHIEVTLREFGGRAVIIIEDDGRGIEPTRARSDAGHGLGLLGMTRQTSWLGGRITIGRRPGGGTRIRISIPIDRHRRSAPVASATPDPVARVAEPAVS